MTLHLYGVVRATHPLPASTSATLVAWQDLAIVVATLPDDRAPTAADAMSQLELLRALVHNGPVVPLKFGTVAQDQNAIRAEVLQPAATGLRDQLNRLDGLAEVHVYLRFDEHAALTAVADQQPGSVRSGRATFADQINAGEQIARRLVAWRQAQADGLLAPVRDLAREVVSLPEHEHTHERRAFLMPLTEVAAAEAHVNTLGTEELAAEFVGPLPVYSFLTPAETATATDSRWGW